MPTSRCGNDFPLPLPGLAGRGEEFALVRVDPEAQLLRAHQGDEVALAPPGRGIAERGDQIVVGLRAIRRAVSALHRAGDEDDGVAGHRELALAALAPELEHHLAVVADL